MVIYRRQMDAIQEYLESVTGELFQRKVLENDEKSVLITWQNDTRVGYLFHVIKLGGDFFQVAFAIQRHRDIETHFDRRMNLMAMKRLLDDPRQCVRYMVGQNIG